MSTRVTPAKDKGAHITVWPLRVLPVIRDSEVDMVPFWVKHRSVVPYFVGGGDLLRRATIMNARSCIFDSRARAERLDIFNARSATWDCHLVRWNAAVMVARANHRFDGVGGHAATYASAAPVLRSRHPPDRRGCPPRVGPAPRDQTEAVAEAIGRYHIGPDALDPRDA